MGQKTNPIGFRLGVIRGWDSNWYTDGSFADKIVEDEEIRRYLDARLKRAGLSPHRHRAHAEARHPDAAHVAARA